MLTRCEEAKDMTYALKSLFQRWRAEMSTWKVRSQGTVPRWELQLMRVTKIRAVSWEEGRRGALVDMVKRG